MNLLIVFNLWAGHGFAKKILADLQTSLESQAFTFDLVMTTAPGNGTQIVAEADFENYDGIIAAGGDGTLFEVINGYYGNPSKKRPPIGVIPVGTGNAFVRDMQLHDHDWQQAIDIISGGITRPCDVGRFETESKTWYYLNILGLGLVADIGATASKLKIFGNVSYTLGTFYHLMKLNPYQVTLVLDGERIERENIFVEVSNTRYTANFLMAPNAKTDDGLLDVTILGPKSRIGLMRSFPKILTGDHLAMPEVETWQARDISIETNIPKILTPDGELMGSTPLSIHCLHKDIQVFWKPA